jgi:decaprenyl-phosphate phosphoribosyltransferase
MSESSAEIVRPTLRGHVEMMRLDHWVKNVFVLPGIAAALMFEHPPMTGRLLLNMVLGLAATCLIASSNYVINEVLDAPFDRLHPIRCRRPVPEGRASVPVAYVQWITLMAAGIGLAALVSTGLWVSEAVFWVMGLIYNVKPFRTKDVPYLDVVSEAVNNPLRMLAGWYSVSPQSIPPASLLVSYWLAGCYFMAIKRLAEVRELGDRIRAAAYRASLGFYTEPKLLVSIVFFGSSAMLFFGAFLMRYRLELVLSFPLVALVMAAYLGIGLKPDSAAQYPEKLYREPVLMAAVIACAAAMLVLAFVDVPVLHRLVAPTVPPQPAVPFR